MRRGRSRAKFSCMNVFPAKLVQSSFVCMLYFFGVQKLYSPSVPVHDYSILIASPPKVYNGKSLSLWHLMFPSYKPMEYYEKNPELKKAIDQIRDGAFCPTEPGAFHDIVNSILHHDRYYTRIYCIMLLWLLGDWLLRATEYDYLASSNQSRIGRHCIIVNVDFEIGISKLKIRHL